MMAFIIFILAVTLAFLIGALKIELKALKVIFWIMFAIFGTISAIILTFILFIILL